MSETAPAQTSDSIGQALTAAVSRALTVPRHPDLTQRFQTAARALCGSPGEIQNCLCKLGMARYCFAMKLHGGQAMAVVLALDSMKT